MSRLSDNGIGLLTFIHKRFFLPAVASASTPTGFKPQQTDGSPRARHSFALSPVGRSLLREQAHDGYTHSSPESRECAMGLFRESWQ